MKTEPVGGVAVRAPSPASSKQSAPQEFTRITWAGESARAEWQPRLQRIGEAWSRIEWLAVVDGARRCALTTVPPHKLPRLAADVVPHTLSALPIQIHGASGSSYSAAATKAQSGGDFTYRVVLARSSDALEFHRAWAARDEAAIGRLLGYPSCCSEFFQRSWVKKNLRDTTWDMASTASPVRDLTVDVSGPPHANILWRWMGVRFVPHLPCRFDCPATIELGRRFEAVGRRAGFEREVDWMLELLSLPVQWTARDGVARIDAGLLRCETSTDRTSGERTVRFRGGVRTGPERASASAERAIATPIALGSAEQRERAAKEPPAPSADAWRFEDNGFASLAAMDAAHAPIVELAVAELGDAPSAVLDLGCGNGALLRKICEQRPNVEAFGVELDPRRVAHARDVLPAFAANLACASMFDCERIWANGKRYALAIVMPGRLLEVDSWWGALLRERLREQCDRVLVYAYGDWRTRFGDLGGLAERAHFLVDATTRARPAAMARIPHVVAPASNNGTHVPVRRAGALP